MLAVSVVVLGLHLAGFLNQIFEDINLYKSITDINSNKNKILMNKNGICLNPNIKRYFIFFNFIFGKCIFSVTTFYRLLAIIPKKKLLKGSYFKILIRIKLLIALTSR
jgi:hypothetical protein